MKLNIRLNFLLVIFIFFQIKICAEVIIKEQFNNKKLDYIAIDNGCGYKTANLTFLRNYVVENVNKWLENKKIIYKFSVPEFICVPTEKILFFIKNSLGFNLSGEWEKLKDKYLKKKDKIIFENKYPDGFDEARNKIESELKRKFDDFISNSTEISLNNIFKISGLDEFLNNIHKNYPNLSLMVRSTGKEDTDKLANAGGNESVANVFINTKSILNAIKIVVASYIGKKSLTQRLGAKDTSIFLDNVPFVPVLLQLMIGETDFKKLPRCGVMFTEEPDGGISRKAIKNDLTGIKTSLITIIQAAYGYNEGVVNSRIPVDTFYSIVSLKKNDYLIEHIYPVIRNKTHRIKPIKDGEVGLIANDVKEVVQGAALTVDMVNALTFFARALEEFYRKPMDVEFVVDDEKKIIHLVQARPIVHAAKEKFKEASYILLPKNFLTEYKQVGNSIGVADGAVRKIENKNNIIVAQNLGEALKYYQFPVTNRSIIESILVEKMAPSTSHEATAFRSEVKPIVCVNDLKIIENWLLNEKQLVVSPQQGLVINVSDSDFDKNYIKNGWSNYPVPCLVSTIKDFIEIKKSSSSIGDIKNFIDKEHLEKLDKLAKEKKLLSDEKNGGIELLLNVVKSAKKEEAFFALMRLYVGGIGVLQDLEKKATDYKIITEKTRDEIALLKKHITACVQLVSKMLDYMPDDIDYTRRLFAVRFLEAIFLQQPKYGEIVKGDSIVLSGLRGLQKDIEIFKKTGVKDLTVITLFRLQDAAFTDTMRKDIEFFIKDLDIKAINLLVNLVKNLFDLNILPAWLCTSFSSACEKLKSKKIEKNFEERKSKILKELFTEYENDKIFLDELNEKNKEITALNHEIFRDPKKFKIQWGLFSNNLITYFLSDKFSEKFKNAKILGKFAAISIMRNFIEKFDLSIKALETSPLDEWEKGEGEKLTSYRIMLEKYFAVFNKWIQLVPYGAIKYSDLVLSESEKNLGYTVYTKYIEDVFSRAILRSDSSDFNLTSNFNVTVFTVTSGYRLGEDTELVQKPITLVDIFTTIHQNIIATLDVLSLQVGIKNIARPELLEKVEKLLVLLPHPQLENVHPNLLGVGIKENAMNLYYNLPLEYHSIRFDLNYFKKTFLQDEQVIITAHLYGDTPTRWVIIGSWFLLAKAAKFVEFSNIKISDYGVDFGIIVDKNSDIEKIINILYITIESTYTPMDLYENYEDDLSFDKIKSKDNFISDLLHQISLKHFFYLLQNNILTGLDEYVNKNKIDALFDKLLKEDTLVNLFKNNKVAAACFDLINKYIENKKLKSIQDAREFLLHFMPRVIISGVSEKEKDEFFKILLAISEKYSQTVFVQPKEIFEQANKILVELQNCNGILLPKNFKNKYLPLIYTDEKSDNTQKNLYFYIFKKSILIVELSNNNNNFNLDIDLIIDNSNRSDVLLAIYIDAEKNGFSLNNIVNKKMGKFFIFSASVKLNSVNNLSTFLNNFCADLIADTKILNSKINNFVLEKNIKNESLKDFFIFIKNFVGQKFLKFSWSDKNQSGIVRSLNLPVLIDTVIPKDMTQFNINDSLWILEQLLSINIKERENLPYEYKLILKKLINKLTNFFDFSLSVVEKIINKKNTTDFAVEAFINTVKHNLNVGYNEWWRVEKLFKSPKIMRIYEKDKSNNCKLLLFKALIQFCENSKKGSALELIIKENYDKLVTILSEEKIAEILIKAEQNILGSSKNDYEIFLKNLINISWNNLYNNTELLKCLIFLLKQISDLNIDSVKLQEKILNIVVKFKLYGDLQEKKVNLIVEDNGSLAYDKINRLLDAQIKISKISFLESDYENIVPKNENNLFEQLLIFINNYNLSTDSELYKNKLKFFLKAGLTRLRKNLLSDAITKIIEKKLYLTFNMDIDLVDAIKKVCIVYIASTDLAFDASINKMINIIFVNKLYEKDLKYIKALDPIVNSKSCNVNIKIQLFNNLNRIKENKIKLEFANMLNKLYEQIKIMNLKS